MHYWHSCIQVNQSVFSGRSTKKRFYRPAESCVSYFWYAGTSMTDLTTWIGVDRSGPFPNPLTGHVDDREGWLQWRRRWCGQPGIGWFRWPGSGDDCQLFGEPQRQCRGRHEGRWAGRKRAGVAGSRQHHRPVPVRTSSVVQPRALPRRRLCCAAADNRCPRCHHRLVQFHSHRLSSSSSPSSFVVISYLMSSYSILFYNFYVSLCMSTVNFHKRREHTIQCTPVYLSVQ